MVQEAKNKEIRVRMAPSPTGFLHVGTARTAIFNWLFAKAQKGKFILRIEDTDKERNKPEYEEDIINQLKWLGIGWDEFYKQSERTAIYKDHLKNLLDEEKAYYCFCAKEDLEAEKASLSAAGLPPKYSGRCRALTKDAALKRVIDGEKSVIRFKVAEKEVGFKDIVRGDVKFDAKLFGDQVIARDLENPLYNFVVVVDDILMEITHVIRGEDHLSNTPRQILLYEAFSAAPPTFAHLPLILNPDRSKMSKRFLDVSLKEYRAEGYLPEAMFNFISFLGWHPKEDKEIMAKDEIIAEFSLERVQKAGAVFNIQKLDWLNAHYVMKLSPEEFINLAKPYLPENWRLSKPMALSVMPRTKKMSEIKDLVVFYFDLPDYPAEKLRWKNMDLAEVSKNLTKVSKILGEIGENTFNKENLEHELVEATKDQKKGEIFWPLRFALSGSDSSPTPFEIMEGLGKNETLRRINLALEKLK